MEKMKEFFRNISKTGWIIISIIIVLILLFIIGALLRSNGVSFWSNDMRGDEITSEEGEQILAQLDRALQSAQDSVLSIEDVLSGEYNNSVAAATLFVKNTKEVKVAVVINEDKYQIDGTTQERCGKFALVSVRVPDQPDIINQTMNSIFSNKVITDFEPGNTIPKYNPDLVFDNATLENGVAKIYLRGEFGEKEGAGCVQELALYQIEQTARQFSSVKEVEVYQNLQRIN